MEEHELLSLFSIQFIIDSNTMVMKTLFALALIFAFSSVARAQEARPFTRRLAIEYGDHDGDTWEDLEEGDDSLGLRRLIETASDDDTDEEESSFHPDLSYGNRLLNLMSTSRRVLKGGYDDNKGGNGEIDSTMGGYGDDDEDDDDDDDNGGHGEAPSASPTFGGETDPMGGGYGGYGETDDEDEDDEDDDEDEYDDGGYSGGFGGPSTPPTFGSEPEPPMGGYGSMGGETDPMGGGYVGKGDTPPTFGGRPEPPMGGYGSMGEETDPMGGYGSMFTPVRGLPSSNHRVENIFRDDRRDDGKRGSPKNIIIQNFYRRLQDGPQA